MSLILDAHRQYLQDSARVQGFSQAISEIVQSGDTVLDLGSGTGILGLLACRAGAKRVYSIDSHGIIDLARRIAAANEYSDRVIFLQDLSTKISLPEKVDVVISDQIGRFGFEAGILEYFPDAKERFLRPGGRMIPSGFSLHIAPVELPEMYSNILFWNESLHGFDFRPARKIALNTGYPVKFVPGDLLADPIQICNIDLNSSDVRFPPKMEGVMNVTREGVMHGVAGWFSATLSPNVTISNSPLWQNRINRRNVFFPIEHAVSVEKGNKVITKMQILPADHIVAWNVQIQNSSGSSKSKSFHSTWEGMLFSHADLKRSNPDFVPKLTKWGKARESVLKLCNGERSLKQVEEELYNLHSDLFQSHAEAAKFVAEVVLRYTL